MTDLPDSVTDGTANQSAVIGLEITGEPTGLYRFYDRVERLLYVGISRNLHTRWGQHAGDKTWWPLVAKRTVVMYPSRAEAEKAEKAAIRSERPVHNKTLTGDPKPGAAHSLPPCLRKPEAKAPSRTATRATPRPRESFVLNAAIQSQADDYARKHGISSAEAVQKFFCDGLIKCLEEDFEAELAAYEAETPGIRAALAARKAERQAAGTPVPG